MVISLHVTVTAAGTRSGRPGYPGPGGGREAGLAPADERDTTCCYARQDKFWVQGAPGGERWEIYTVLEDSQTFWGEAGEQSWQAAEGALDAAPRAASAAALDAGQVSPCCGAAPEAAGHEAGGSQAGACCA